MIFLNNDVLWLWLCVCVGLNRKKQLILLNKFKTIENIYNANLSLYREFDFLSPEELNLLSNKDLKNAENELKKISDFGAFVLTIDNADYPKVLKEIYDPPTLLYCKGKLVDMNKRLCISVVGTRKATAYGKSCAKNLSKALASQGVIIVSGLALGIDAFSHKGALEAGAPTVAVIGSGLDVPYPPANANLMKEIEQTGLVMSEYPLGSSPERFHFPERNRIISGVSQGIIVIEADLKSGSLITAKSATDQGREVFAVPGNINSVYSLGTNNLIKDGAKMALDANEIINDFKFNYPDRVFCSINFDEALYSTKEEKPSFSEFSSNEEKIISVLKEGRANADIVCEKTGIAISSVNSALLILELKGEIIKSAGGYYELNTKF